MSATAIVEFAAATVRARPLMGHRDAKHDLAALEVQARGGATWMILVIRSLVAFDYVTSDRGTKTDSELQSSYGITPYRWASLKKLYMYRDLGVGYQRESPAI